MILNKLFLLIPVLICYCDALDIGEFCTLETSNSQGVCEIITKCPKAIEDLGKGIRPTSCGFSGTVPIVCCARSSPASQPTTTSTTTTTRPTTTTTRTTTSRSVNLNLPKGEISKEKCKEYGTHVYQLIKPPVFLAPKINVSKCAVTSKSLIVGGEMALLKEFPHQAVLGYDLNNEIKWQCGGSLISDEYVVTAAHCLDAGVNGGKVKYIRLGDLNYERTNDGAKPETFTVDRVIPHPNYKPPSQYNDIALLKLNKPVVFNEYIRPICLQTEFVINNNPNGPRVLATGYGRTQFAGEQSSDLLKVVLDSFPHSECNAIYKSQSKRKLSKGIDNQSQLCAGSKTEEKDTCQGDSGGPLQVYHPDVYCMYKLVGVTSFGKACGTVGVPGVYTRISNYIEWLEREVWGVTHT